MSVANKPTSGRRVEDSERFMEGVALAGCQSDAALHTVY